MKKWAFLALVAFSTLADGCGLMRYRYKEYDFAPGQEKQAQVGSPMVTWADYERDGNGAELNRFEQTLTYSGKQGSTVRISYRESSQVPQPFMATMVARPAYTQDLTYDLAESDVIAFRDNKLKVIEANGSGIRFIVLESPSYAAKSGLVDPRATRASVAPTSVPAQQSASPSTPTVAAAPGSAAPTVAAPGTSVGHYARPAVDADFVSASPPVLGDAPYKVLYSPKCPGYDWLATQKRERAVVIESVSGATADGFSWANGCAPNQPGAR